MYKIKTLNPISSLGLDLLDSAKYTIADEIPNPDAILVRSAKMHDEVFNPELLCVARAGAGVNNIPLERCAEEGIVVFNTPGANARAVVELVFCGMLMAARDIPGGMNWMKTIADDPEVVEKVEKGKAQFTGPELYGKTLGVIGLGAIGYKTANAAAAFGMNVLGYDPYLSAETAKKISAGVKLVDSLEAVYKQCDYISLHLPATKDTTGMIDEKAIAQMKDEVRIINMARAELVNDDAILAALGSGKVARYVTDFPNAKTADAKGVIAIPHLGASTPESEDNCAIMAAEETRDYLEHGNIRNSVNMPDAYLEPSGSVRLCFFHCNSPAATPAVLKILADKGIKETGMMEKTNNKYAYCIIDVNAPVEEALAEQIRQIDGVVRVRVIG